MTLDEIEHDPYVLLSIISAWQEGEWTLAEVQDTLQMLFDRQYILTEDVVVEGAVSDGNPDGTAKATTTMWKCRTTTISAP